MGEGMSIREYAKSRNVAYESVRRQTKRYKQELKGHITQKGSSNILDAAAIEFLDQHRAEKTTIISADKALQDENKRLKGEIERMRSEADKLKNELLKNQQEHINLQNDYTNLLKEKAEATLLLETNKTTVEGLQNELNRYQKTFFGLYRKE